MPNLSNRIVASNCGPMKPRGVAWNGAGGWLIFSQSRQVNFSRTVSISLNRRGISSSVSVTSSPSFARRDPPQHAQLVGASMTTRSRSMSSGHGLRTGRLRVKARTAWVFAAAVPAASSSSLAVVTSSSSSNSNCSISRAVRSERCPYSSRLSFSIRSSRCAISASLADSSARALAATASACSRASRSACSAARALTRSDGRSSGFDIMKPLNQITLQIQTVKRLSDPRWSQRFLRVAPIDSGQQIAHLRR